MSFQGRSDQSSVKPLLNLKPKLSDEAELKEFCEKNCEPIAPGIPILPRTNEDNQKEAVKNIQSPKGMGFPGNILFPFLFSQWVKPRTKRVVKDSQKKKGSKRKRSEKEAHRKQRKNPMKDGNPTSGEDTDKKISKGQSNHCTVKHICSRKLPPGSESQPSYSGQENLLTVSQKYDPAQSKAGVENVSARSCDQCCQGSRDHIPHKNILDDQRYTVNMSPVAGNKSPEWKGDGNSPSLSCRPEVDTSTGTKVLAPPPEWSRIPYEAHTTPFSPHEKFSPCPCCQYPPSIVPMPMAPYYYRSSLFTNRWPSLNESLHTQAQHSSMIGPYHSPSESQYGMYGPSTATSPLPFNDKGDSYSFHHQQQHYGASCYCFYCQQHRLMYSSTLANHAQPVFSSPNV